MGLHDSCIYLNFQIPPHSKELIFDQKARSLDESCWIQQKSIQFWRVWKFVKQLDWEILGLRKFFKIKRELFSFVELRKNLDNLAKIWQKSDKKCYRLYAYGYIEICFSSFLWRSDSSVDTAIVKWSNLSPCVGSSPPDSNFKFVCS